MLHSAPCFQLRRQERWLVGSCQGFCSRALRSSAFGDLESRISQRCCEGKVAARGFTGLDDLVEGDAFLAGGHGEERCGRNKR